MVEERRVLRPSHNYPNASTGQQNVAMLLFDQRPGTKQRAILQPRVNLPTSTGNLPTVNWFVFNVWSIIQFYQRPQAIYLRSIGLYFQRRQSSASRGQRFNTTGSSFSVTRHSTNTDNSNSTIMLFAIIYYYHNVIPLLNCMRVHAQGFAVSINTLSYSILRRTDDSTSSTSCVADDIRSG